MQFPQLKSEDGRIELEVGQHRATLYIDGRKAAAFDVKHEDAFSTADAEAMGGLDPSRWLVAFNRSSPQARSMLRTLGISYASPQGEIYVHAPPVHVEIPARRRSFLETPGDRSSPFAIRASRIPRWLLLHPEETPSFTHLRSEVDLSASVVSRTLRALADEGLVAISQDRNDSRMRRVRVEETSALLRAFEQASIRRRVPQRSWDVGSRDPAKTLDRLRRAAKRTLLPYALGGLAGAAMFAKVVEPASIDVWIGREDLDAWTEELMATPARPRPGAITFRPIPDPFLLSLAWERRKLQVADPVQLYLDCRRAGERALDAADLIRREMRW
jgi:DNA-binding transcriptional ArsR family regulator